ncbi:signal peptidase I SipW [Priestia taiwanensis]|uniref:Signal peptidase I n=1 Tax=Priestia taiwanensis TaxID=1347902 RepID=A0A917AV16_9BACI|nr:signal peptidase I [Priestia taiwanensis]MBM7363398.1 signal peptidase [Priestia taiwanensis]GGE77475.1 S26 family signal peptidase [Priestia taiwanensis]
MTKKKILKIVSSIMSTLLFLLMLSLAIVVISSKASGGNPTVMGYQLKTVLSGSMEPTFQTGSIIAIKPTEDGGKSYKKDDVIIFKEADNKIVTHRVVEVKGEGNNLSYVTKGDNNDGPDTNPVLAQNVIGHYTDFTVPYVGYLLDYANSKMGAALLLIIPGIILLIYSGVSIFGAVRELEGKGKNEDPKSA